MAAAIVLYRMVGVGMDVFGATPLQVDTLFDVDLLRSAPSEAPTPLLDTTWTPATRTLATTALPLDVTRLEAWREGPGGTP